MSHGVSGTVKKGLSRNPFAQAGPLDGPGSEATSPKNMNEAATNIKMLQIESAMKAISNKGYTAIAICTDEGVVLASQIKIRSPHIKVQTLTNLYSFCDHIGAVMVGDEADCRFLASKARHIAHHFRFAYGYQIPVQTLTKRLADVIHLKTLKKDERILNCSILIGCIDEYKGSVVFKTDPSADFWGFNAFSIGANADQINEILKSSYKRGMTLDESIQLAISCLKKFSKNENSVNNFEVGLLTKENQYFHILSKTALHKYVAPRSA